MAALNFRERHHRWVRDILDSVDAELFTCEAVLTETLHLASATPARQAIATLVAKGLLKVPFRLEAESGAVFRLMEKYQSVPMSFADGCLVRMSELWPEAHVMTLDSDFTVYRRNRNQPIPVVMP